MAEPVAQTAQVKLAGNVIELETGRIARQASGAVVVRCGDCVLLATAVIGDAERENPFFPLTVEYREKLAAAGRIPGSINRREGRITDHEVLTSRLIDRSVRSLFPDGYRVEVQVQVSVLSADPAADTTSLALLGACAALHLSEAPLRGPVAGLRMILTDEGEWLPLATARQRSEARADIVVSAGPDGLVMAEGEAQEVAADTLREGLERALEHCEKLAAAAESLRKAAGRPTPQRATGASPDAAAALPEAIEAQLGAALRCTDKTERRQAIAACRAALLDSADPDGAEELGPRFDARAAQLVRERILAGERLDGRAHDEIRPIWSEIGWLPRAHGSAIFTRGETQALVTCTLGTDEDALRTFSLAGEGREHFILHYSFPPYSVGECRPMRGPGRREIGHGNLARRGLDPAVPGFADFPYTLRIESEISESNGSSSMATVCGATLAMLHAGVPLTRPVAGIAMGLVSEGERTAILSDILGDEDHLGDMDFKVVGTARGVTAIQLDNKIGGLEFDVLARALDQAVIGVTAILDRMRETIADPAKELPPHAPRVLTTAIPPSAISVLVGPRGANIKGIAQDTGARVNVDDFGVVHVYAAEQQAARRALRRVGRSAGVVQREKYYTGTVTGVKDFGVFVKLNDITEGLVPLEELREQRGGGKPDESEFPPGSELIVQVLGADERGRLRLSRRGAIGVDDAAVEW